MNELLGSKVTQANFQQIMDMMLVGFDFAVEYFDDILIRSRSKDEHVQHLSKVCERIKVHGFEVSKNKCGFLMLNIHYQGQIIDKNDKGYKIYASSNRQCFITIVSWNSKL